MKNTSSYNRYLLKRILFLNIGSVIVIVFTYLWMLFFLSHVNSFWEIFRGKEKYEVKDTIPPVSPYIENIPESIKEDKITISGRSEPNTKVILYTDEIKQNEVIADADGNFIFADIPVGFAPTNIYVTATDQAGNVSSKSRIFKILRDIEPPIIEITAPKKNEVFKSTERTYMVKGKTDPGSIVNINEQIAPVDSEGLFSALINLKDGGNEIEIKVTDKAGNEAEQKIYMTFDKIK